ncbi:hypothetical protein PDESU_00325 [Pontiella desulfatans]|uniref:Uncharacterized protein n=1 Tax=Pontiella desulfatans TaxID=2750659 RepID=A0A6C2TVY5_PONDE|nr:hypothetical protein PDESU_00325 [Pontiella desulfatans]
MEELIGMNEEFANLNKQASDLEKTISANISALVNEQ